MKLSNFPKKGLSLVHEQSQPNIKGGIAPVVVVLLAAAAAAGLSSCNEGGINGSCHNTNNNGKD